MAEPICAYRCGRLTRLEKVTREKQTRRCIGEGVLCAGWTGDIPVLYKMSNGTAGVPSPSREK